MRGSRMGLLAAAMLAASVAGCALPEVLPLAGGTHQGPSPYGPWYEQHWATNAVLLAASDQPDDDEFTAEEQAEIDAALGEEASAVEVLVDPNAVGEVKASVHPEENVEFDNSTPFQFPAGSFAPPPRTSPDAYAPRSDNLAPPPVGSPTGKTAASEGTGPIRY